MLNIISFLALFVFLTYCFASGPTKLHRIFFAFSTPLAIYAQCGLNLFFFCQNNDVCWRRENISSLFASKWINAIGWVLADCWWHLLSTCQRHGCISRCASVRCGQVGWQRSWCWRHCWGCSRQRSGERNASWCACRCRHVSPIAWRTYSSFRMMGGWKREIPLSLIYST